MPERTVLLRVDPDAAHARGQQRLAAGEDDGSDRFESEGVEFQRTVARAYDEIAARHPERITVVDGGGRARRGARGGWTLWEESVGGLTLSYRFRIGDDLADVTSEQRSARIALAAALEAPSHAYLFAGPAGSGKREPRVGSLRSYSRSMRRTRSRLAAGPSWTHRPIPIWPGFGRRAPSTSSMRSVSGSSRPLPTGRSRASTECSSSRGRTRWPRRARTRS